MSAFGGKADIRIIELAASVHCDLRASHTIQQAFEMDACELVLWLLSEMSRKSGNSARIACFQLGNRLQITLRSGKLRNYVTQVVASAESVRLRPQEQMTD